jgi:hypothetical protein
MAVFYTIHERIGTLGIEPKRATLGADGKTMTYSRPLRLKCRPAWMGDADNPTPDIIDTDKLSMLEVADLKAVWGKDWKKQLEDWLEGENGKSWGFAKGDPRPLRPVKVTMTQEEYETYQELTGKKAKAEQPAPRAVGGTRGTRSSRMP